MTSTSRRAAPSASESSPFGRLAGAALLLSASFVASRVLGVLRMSVVAAVFDNSGPVAAYFAAFRIPDTMFMLVSGGALASAFIPLFAGLTEQRNERAAWEMASTVVTTVLLALAGLAAVAFIFAPQIMGALVGSGSGHSGGFTPSERALTVELTRIMLLQPVFLGASAILGAILQTYNRFLLTAVAPLLYNVSVIVGAFLGHRFGVQGLAWSVVIGALAQLLVQIPGAAPGGRYHLRLALDWGSASTRSVLKLFAPRVVGLAAFQAMLFVTLYLAARLGSWAVNAINYSWPLVQFPVGALGMAAGTAIFPTLSRLSTAEDIEGVRRTVNRSLRLVLFLAVPATVGLVILRRPVVNVLYNHGAWSFGDTEQTAFALLFYGLALAPLASIEVLARVFYAMRDTLTPVKIAVVAVTLDAGLSILFVHLLPAASGQGGLALATALANALQVAWLARAAHARLGGLGLASLSGALRDSFLASIAMGLLLYVSLQLVAGVLPQRGLGAVVTIVVEVGLGVAAFSWVAYLLGAPEFNEVLAVLRRGR
jgi:putative peptidoglycan lipid II flippase